ncbi:MAG: restriction endonuclease subunit S [Bacteroidetes bacterium]|nr:restriction endonuclease subunit S [Bacteroidota bacterium]
MKQVAAKNKVNEDSMSDYDSKVPVGWEMKFIADVCNIYVGRDLKENNFSNSKSEEYIVPVYSNTVENEGLYGYYNIEEFSGESTTIVGRGAGLGTAFTRNGKYGAIGRLLVLFPKENVIAHYITEFVNGILQIHQESGGIPQLTGEQISKYKIIIPPLHEQKAIAQVLSTADTAINTTEKLIVQKELRKKWLMQQLLSGKRRLNSFNREVKPKVVGQFIKEVSERNKELKVTRVLSVTNSRGFINQSDQFDRSVASEDASNYKIVRKGQFAYNPSRINVGSLDLLKNFDEGILSPMYVVFSTDEKHLLADFLYFHLKTQWFYGHIPMFVQGSVRDTLSFDGLCSMKFFIPTIEEQTAIVRVLQAADKEISLLKLKADKLREKKKGLMQQLLTGKIRIK